MIFLWDDVKLAGFCNLLQKNGNDVNCYHKM